MKKWLGLALLGVAAVSMADEGMWQPHQLPDLANKLTSMGLQLDPNGLTSLTEFPMNAVISLGGCTASFVSPKGLVVTNHHCAYGSIQYNSSADNNLLEHGFLAKSLADELPATPGSRVYVTEAVTDVTGRVLGALSATLSGAERYQAIEDQRKALVAECEQADGYRCEVYSFHHGLEYYLIKQLEIKDVRLVYTPALSVGKFGGDIDNWMWPRHTGDFAYYRAYVGPDGRPAEFDKANVPYQPKSHLKVSAKGVAEDDFVMVAGYPGRTNRYRTANEVENQFTWAYPTAKQMREDLIDIINTHSAEGSDARIAYESTLAGLANYAKNYGGMIEGYQRSDLLQRKQQLERDLNSWIKATAKRQQTFGEAVSTLDKLVEQAQAHQARDLILAYMRYAAMPTTARKLYRLAHERGKADAEREPGYQQRDMAAFEQGLKRLSKRYDAKVDQAILAHLLHAYAQLPADQRLPALDRFFAIDGPVDDKQLNARLAKLYAGSELADEQVRLAWMDKPLSAFKQADDSWLKFAVALFDTDMALEAEEKSLTGELQQWRPRYMEALIAYQREQGQAVYADANSTLRVTYGSVKGYSPRDGIFYTPFTRLEGISEKETGTWPFNAPSKQLNLIKQKHYGDYVVADLQSVPVNYLSTVDTTGGNSGSPTLNGRAELVGLLFDGTLDSIIGDWDFDEQKNRSIHVDTRYMLWVMQYLDGADNLLAEMDIVR